MTEMQSPPLNDAKSSTVHEQNDTDAYYPVQYPKGVRNTHEESQHLSERICKDSVAELTSMAGPKEL